MGPSLKVGKYATWLGYEVPNTTKNFNITRGNVWTLLQPINHYGVALEGDMDGFTYGIAIVNGGATGLGTSASDPDYNNDKHVMGKLGYGTEMFTGQLAFLWGNETTNYGTSEPVGTLDLLFTADPTEAFSAWLDFTFKYSDDGAPSAWGTALAGRYAFSDTLGFALRGEFVQLTGGDRRFSAFPDQQDDLAVITGPIGNARDADIWGITGTLDYLVTDNLTLKWEVRWDMVDAGPDSTCNTFEDGQSGSPPNPLADCSNQFVKRQSDAGLDNTDAFTMSSQWTTGLELVYQF